MNNPGSCIFSPGESVILFRFHEILPSQFQIKTFRDYVDLYVKDRFDENEQPLKVVHEKIGPRWEVAVTSSDKGFQQASFVNSIATTKVRKKEVRDIRYEALSCGR